jgi:endonuclease/exonuclease/phosphatase family metal-dependent hydrolase
MRIVSYNIRGGLGIDNTRSTERIVAVLSALSPLADIICLQEVHERTPWANFINQPSQFRQLLPDYSVAMMRCIDLKVGGYGIAILSRLPIIHTHRHRLPLGPHKASKPIEPRGLLEIELENVTVFNTHWGLSPEERLEQGETVAKILSKTTKPVILCGDFNERAEEAGVTFVRENVGLLDADAAHNRFTYATDNPYARIDFILHSPALVCESVMLVETLIATQASDHFPLVADFSNLLSPAI